MWSAIAAKCHLFTDIQLCDLLQIIMYKHEQSTSSCLQFLSTMGTFYILIVDINNMEYINQLIEYINHKIHQWRLHLLKIIIYHSLISVAVINTMTKTNLGVREGLFHLTCLGYNHHWGTSRNSSRNWKRIHRGIPLTGSHPGSRLAKFPRLRYYPKWPQPSRTN